MRVLILTADSVIDRDIAPQADLLAQSDCEVIVLAAREPTQPAFERIDAVKVEHCDPIALNRLGRRIGLLCSKATNGLNQMSENTDNFISGRITALDNRVGNLSRGNSSRYSQTPRCLMLVAARNGYVKLLSALSAIYGFVEHLISAVERTGGWLGRRLPGARKSLNAVMLDRAVYYDPDIVHIHGAACLPVGARIKDALRIPLIYDAEDPAQSLPQEARDRYKRASSLERRYRRVADRVLIGHAAGDDRHGLLAVYRELARKPGGLSA